MSVPVVVALERARVRDADRMVCSKVNEEGLRPARPSRDPCDRPVLAVLTMPAARDVVSQLARDGATVCRHEHGRETGVLVARVLLLLLGQSAPRRGCHIVAVPMPARADVIP